MLISLSSTKQKMVTLTATPMSFAAAAAAPPPPTSITIKGSVLHTPFVFSYMRRGGSNKKSVTSAAPAATNETSVDDPTKSSDADTGTAKSNSATNLPIQPTAIYETSIQVIRQIHTVEEFWETYDYMKRPNELNSLSPPNVDYHFFRVLKNSTTGKYLPIKPTWEDVRCYFCCSASLLLWNIENESIYFNEIAYITIACNGISTTILLLYLFLLVCTVPKFFFLPNNSRTIPMVVDG